MVWALHPPNKNKGLDEKMPPKGLDPLQAGPTNTIEAIKVDQEKLFVSLKYWLCCDSQRIFVKAFLNHGFRDWARASRAPRPHPWPRKTDSKAVHYFLAVSHGWRSCGAAQPALCGRLGAPSAAPTHDTQHSSGANQRKHLPGAATLPPKIICVHE